MEGRHVEWHIIAVKRGRVSRKGWSIVSNETQAGGGGRELRKRPLNLTTSVTDSAE